MVLFLSGLKTLCSHSSHSLRRQKGTSQFMFARRENMGAGKLPCAASRTRHFGKRALFFIGKMCDAVTAQQLLEALIGQYPLHEALPLRLAFRTSGDGAIHSPDTSYPLRPCTAFAPPLSSMLCCLAEHPQVFRLRNRGLGTGSFLLFRGDACPRSGTYVHEPLWKVHLLSG